MPSERGLHRVAAALLEQISAWLLRDEVLLKVVPPQHHLVPKFVERRVLGKAQSVTGMHMKVVQQSQVSAIQRPLMEP